MLALDANLWIAAFDPTDLFHADSVAVLLAASKEGLELVGPSFVILETVCALARRLRDPDAARAAGEKLAVLPSLRLESVDSLLSAAEHLGVECRLRAADSIYVATAVRCGCPLLSWDRELITRGGAISPRDWLAARSENDRPENAEE